MDIVERYRRDVADFHSDTERIMRGLEEANQSLNTKNNQIRELSLAYAQKTEQKVVEWQ
jgi:hypothetical protein